MKFSMQLIQWIFLKIVVFRKIVALTVTYLMKNVYFIRALCFLDRLFNNYQTD